MGDRHKIKQHDDHHHPRHHHRRQKHVHEFLGSVMNVRPPGEDIFHNHRFAGVSGPAEYTGCDRDHVHVLKTKTDFFEDHYHKIDVTTGGAIPVYDENQVEIGHTHGFTGVTEISERHNHVFKVATLIEDPLGPAEDDGREHKKHKRKDGSED